jgi:hypothetical protein
MMNTTWCAAGSQHYSPTVKKKNSSPKLSGTPRRWGYLMALHVALVEFYVSFYSHRSPSGNEILDCHILLLVKRYLFGTSGP